MNAPENFGKKVFFLYPHSVVEETLLNAIIKNEYEVYLVKDHEKIKRVLADFPDSILFINIDGELEEPEWAAYTQNLKEDPKTAQVRVGILTYNDDKELAKKYLLDLMVPCGFVILKLGIEQSSIIILKMLEANEARGKRKYVRAVCPQGSAELNIKAAKGGVDSGVVANLSSVGMACTFSGGLEFNIGTKFSDIQLRLKGMICMLSGVIIGKRLQEGVLPLYVVMFDPSSIAAETKAKIHQYVYSTLQAEMNKRL